MDPIQNPRYCPMFFKGMYVEKSADRTVRQGHCCASHRMGVPAARVDFYHYPMFEHNRKHWHEAPVAGCDPCWTPDGNGHHSFRKGYLDWLEKQEQHLDPLRSELLKLDYNVGPTCNAKCVHCSSHYSSLWAAEENKFTGSDLVKFSNITGYDVMPDIDVSQLRTLYINGGEPFMSDDPQRLLQKIDQQGDLAGLTFQTNTNGSIRPSDSMIELWMRCRRVDIFVSVDAIEQQFEYIRYPLKWDQVEANIDYLSGLSANIHVTFSFALGLHNIDELERTWRWFLDKRNTRKQPETAFGIHECYGRLHFANASQAIKQVWRGQLDPKVRWTPWILTLLDGPSAPDDKIWLDYLQELDRRRDLHWRSSLHRLAGSLEKVWV